MPNFNHTTLSGRLTKVPEIRYTPKGTAVTDLNLAVDSLAGKDREKKTNFFYVTVFGKQAESCQQYLVKGQEVGVTGRLEMNQWEDQEGQKRSRLQIIAQQVNFGVKPRGQLAAA